MDDKKAQALIATCIDFRFQEEIDAWIDKNFKPDTYDRVSMAGCVIDLEDILEQVKVARDLHHIEKVVLINHEDCGAYGEEGTPKKHAEDLKAAKEKINALYSDLEVETYYLHLDGEFEIIR